jgi:hypothetical protein
LVGRPMPIGKWATPFPLRWRRLLEAPSPLPSARLIEKRPPARFKRRSAAPVRAVGDRDPCWAQDLISWLDLAMSESSARFVVNGLFPIEGVGPDFAVVGASVRG